MSSGDVAQSLGEDDLCVVAHGGSQDLVCPFQAGCALKLKASRHVDCGTFRCALDGGVWGIAGFEAELENVSSNVKVVVEFEYHVEERRTDERSKSRR